MKTSGIRSLQDAKKANVRRNSVFAQPAGPITTQSSTVKISLDKRQLRYYWSSVDAAIFSILGHGKERLKKIRKNSQEKHSAGSEKNTLQSREVRVVFHV
jgi:hypothetical protein